jgi:hypothetical protein
MLTVAAEQWAETGLRVKGQVSMRRQPAPLSRGNRKAA